MNQQAKVFKPGFLRAIILAGSVAISYSVAVWTSNPLTKAVVQKLEEKVAEVEAEKVTLQKSQRDYEDRVRSEINSEYDVKRAELLNEKSNLKPELEKTIRSQLQEEFDKKKLALDTMLSNVMKTYFGPLDELTKVTETPSFSALETQLYFNQLCATPSLQTQSQVVYEGNFGNVSISVQSSDHNKNLVLTKSQGGKLLEAHVYIREKQGSSLSELLSEAVPQRSLIIRANDVVFVSYSDSVLKQLRDTKEVYVSSLQPNIDIFRKKSEQILSEFRKLHERGPIPPETATQGVAEKP